MSNKTYIHKSAKQMPAFRAWKDRLTLVVCGNAAGHMTKPGVVCRAKNPRALILVIIIRDWWWWYRAKKAYVLLFGS